MSKYGYRTVWYDSRKKCVHLWAWDASGNRIEQIEPFNPYLYIETSTKGDAVSVFNTNLKKITFPSQFERRRYVKDCGVKRLFFNLKAEQQFLLEKYIGLNESLEFSEKPLKICPLDIEVYSPYEFPHPDHANHPINLLTFYDSLSQKFHTYGLKAYHTKQDNVIYHHCSSEGDLLQKFLETWEEDYPDVITGWNCISHNQYVWESHKISKISKLSENIPLFTQEKNKNNINIFMNTGIKEEICVESIMGHKILCSEEHIFPICSKKQHEYKNSNSLLNTEYNTKVKDIIFQNDNYLFIQKHKNTNNPLTYKKYIIDNWELLKSWNMFDFVIKSDKIKHYLKQFKHKINIPAEYWQGKKFWKHKGWNYRNLQKHLNDELIIDYISNETHIMFCFMKKFWEADINLPIENDILRMLGFTFTDGCVDFKTFTNQYSSKYQDLTEKYTSVYNKLNDSNIKLSRKQKSDNNYYKRVSCNNKFGLLLPFIYENNKKHLTLSPLSQLSYEQFISFYSGLIDGDGNVSSQLNLCNYDNRSEDYLNILQQILLWNGVISIATANNISIPFCLNNKAFIKDLDIWHHDRKTKLEEITFFSKQNSVSNKIKWFDYENFILVKINKIYPTGRAVEMYDMETDTHYFTCNGIKTHNCDGFDIPYLINRITKILGEDDAKRLSPVRSIFYKSDIGLKYGKVQGRWVIHGLNCVDYKEIYETFSREKREAYNLDYISQVELQEGKVKINATSLATLSEKNWDEYVDYNIQDVRLLIKLEEKLRFLKTMRIISHKGFSNIEATLGKVMVVTGAVAAQALKRNQILCSFEHEDMGNYSGGFVKEIEPGLKEGVVTFDANSLYPNTIITLNLSPETKIGKITSIDREKDEVTIKLTNGKSHTLTNERFMLFLQKEKISVSKAKTLFSQKTKGIVPEYVDGLYNERVKIQKEQVAVEKSLAHCKEGSEKYIENKRKMEQYDILQYTLKILLNSIYGVFANRHGPLYDIDCAASITNTGQAVIKAASEILNKYAEEKYGIKEPITHYNDTDSCHITIKPILDSLEQPLLDIKGNIAPPAYDLANELNDHLNKTINEWSANVLNSIDSRFYFKRENICSTGLYQAKKRYILHIKDKGSRDPKPCDKIKPVGVELVKSTMSDAIKKMIERIVITMLHTKSRDETVKVYREIYEQFKMLPPEEVAFRSGIKTYDKYAPQAVGFSKAKRTPVAVAGAIYYNNLIKELNLTSKYEELSSDNRVKWVYCIPQNKYNIQNLAFYDKIPEEFVDIKTDYEKMFSTIMVPAIERLFECARWKFIDLQSEYAVDLLEFFKI